MFPKDQLISFSSVKHWRARKLSPDLKKLGYLYSTRRTGKARFIKLEFTGKRPEFDTPVRVEAGIGGFELIIDKDVSAIIRVNGLAGVDLRGAVRTRSRSFGSGVYETESYKGNGPTLDIRVIMGLGGLTIRTV